MMRHEAVGTHSLAMQLSTPASHGRCRIVIDLCPSRVQRREEGGPSPLVHDWNNDLAAAMGSNRNSCSGVTLSM